mgnify:FL=1
MTKQELADSLRHALYADRPSVGEAFEYALEIAPHGGIGTLTALQVLMNTIANEIEKLED